MSSATSNETLSYCGACKLNLTHQIVSRVDGRVNKVMCKTCQSYHLFREPKGVAEIETAQKVKRSIMAGKAVVKEEKRILTIESLWKEAISKNANSASPLTYSVGAHFLKGQVMKHPKFGLGVIQEEVFPNKVKVIFQDEERVLIHNRTA